MSDDTVIRTEGLTKHYGDVRALEDLHLSVQRGEAPLPVYGGSGVLPGVDLASNAAVRDVMDAESPLMRCVDVNVLVYVTTSAIGYGSTTRGQTMSPWGSAISYCRASFAS